MTAAGAEEIAGLSGKPFCLRLEPDPVLAVLHMPVLSTRQRTAVLFAPPFGWEEMCSFRARRRWAQSLAEAGFPSARIDLPGTGDSGGSPRDNDRLEAWSNAVSGAAQWLRDVTGAGRLVVIGIGMGGLVACQAIATRGPIDDLILWGVAARGRLILRELRAYAGVVAARYPADSQPDSLPEGALDVTGFLVSRETAAAIESVDITKLALPRAAERRVMLIGRDALGVDRKLCQHFTQAGVELTVVDATDYSALMAHPQEALAPATSIRRSIEWLRAGEARAEPRRQPVESAVARDRMEMSWEGTPIVETPISFRIGQGRCWGILSEAASGDRAPICAVLLNAGALRRIGPNRGWVELARRWAARGVPTVRIDFEGIGDSDGDERRYINNAGLYAPDMTDETIALLRELAARGLSEQFVLAGLCSGAYWALHAALADSGVAAAFLINLYAFHWSSELVAERDRRATVTALKGGLVKRILRRGVTAEQARRALRGIQGRVRSPRRGSAEAAQATKVGRTLDKLRDRGTHVLFMFSEGEPLYDQFEREGRIDHLQQWPNVSLEQIPSRDHMSRAIWLQSHVHDSLDAALDRVLHDLPAEMKSSPGGRRGQRAT